MDVEIQLHYKLQLTFHYPALGFKVNGSHVVACIYNLMYIVDCDI